MPNLCVLNLVLCFAIYAANFAANTLNRGGMFQYSKLVPIGMKASFRSERKTAFLLPYLYLFVIMLSYI